MKSFLGIRLSARKRSKRFVILFVYVSRIDQLGLLNWVSPYNKERICGVFRLSFCLLLKIISLYCDLWFIMFYFKIRKRQLCLKYSWSWNVKVWFIVWIFFHVIYHPEFPTGVENRGGGGSSKFDEGGLKPKHGGSLKCGRKIPVKEFIW